MTCRHLTCGCIAALQLPSLREVCRDFDKLPDVPPVGSKRACPEAPVLHFEA